MDKYQQSQKHYAELYGQTTRTIKRWIHTGRGVSDLPPLDDPVKMLSWWALHYKHKAPDAMLEAAKNAPAPLEAEGLLFSASNEQAKMDMAPIELGMGFSEMLERVKRAEADAYRSYIAVINDESRLPSARKVWGELSKQLRELERDAHDILSRSGALFDRSAGEKILAEIHAPIANGIRSMWRRVKARMQGATSDAEEDRVWQEECDRLLYRLNQSAFREAA